MTSPAITLPFVLIKIDHPPAPVVGQPCRIGTLIAIRTYDPIYESHQRDQARGIHVNQPFDHTTNSQMYSHGEVPVSLQHTAWRMRVANLSETAALPGEIVHYIDSLTDNTTDLKTNCCVRPQHPIPVPNAVTGVLLEAISPSATQDVYVLLQYAPRDWHWLSCSAVERRPGVHSGEWVFAGTRVPLTLLFEHLDNGGNVNDFVENYDSVSRDQISQVLLHTAQDLAKYADPSQTSIYPTSEASPRS